MAIIKLTDSEWLKQSADAVEGILRQALRGSAGKPGKDATELKAMIDYAMPPGTFSDADLVLIREELVDRGMIEIVS